MVTAFVQSGSRACIYHFKALPNDFSTQLTSGNWLYLMSFERDLRVSIP